MKRLLLLVALMPSCIFADDEEMPTRRIPTIEYEGHPVDLEEVRLLANATIVLKLDAASVQVKGALSQFQDNTLTLQTSTSPVIIEADDAVWTVGVAQNPQVHVKHHCAKSIYEVGKAIELGLSLTEGDVEVLGPVVAPMVQGSNLNMDPEVSQVGRQLVLSAFQTPENGSLIIGDDTILALEVVQRARIERIEAKQIDNDLYAVRLIERGAAFCHTPRALTFEGCELVSGPDAKQPTHTFKKTGIACQLSLNGEVIGSF